MNLLTLLSDAAPVASGAVIVPLADSTTVGSPLPSGIAEVVRFFFNFPQWAQIGGFFIGLGVGLIALLRIIRHRKVILAWLQSRPPAVKGGLTVGLLLFLVAAGGAGTASWNYMQHDNDFCTGCHVMEHPFDRFQQGAGKHDSLSCHNCHQQSIFASARQLYLWVAERPVEIKVHSKVPTRICAGCHVTDEPEIWQQIASTAGHRTHLESDSVDLKDVECVTCHGLEVHRFVPVDSTCGQSGCHVSTEIKLGEMASQTALHCATCHEFTLEVPALATRDSAAGTLVPSEKQCLSCHEMRQVLSEFDPEFDPHQGSCGTCHNPHTQEAPADAAKTCATAGCHSDWRSEPFHTGREHESMGSDCLTCHQPHRAKVDASDCAGCHEQVRSRARSRGVTPPAPFDTTRALRGRGSPSNPNGGPLPLIEGKGDRGDGEIGRPPPVPWPRQGLPVDTFPHPRHTALACITCHLSDTQHGRLTFEAPRGCQICHHQDPDRNTCADCHSTEALERSLAMTATVTTPEHAPRQRAVSFRHPDHAEKTCVTCHTQAVTLEAPPDVRTCASCHEDHHAPGPTCRSCHAVSVLTESHEDVEESHRQCDACHRNRTIERLIPTRTFCATCHIDQDRPGTEAHYPAKECTSCHFLASPEAYRRHLVGPRSP